MNSAPSKMKSAATDTSEEIRNRAECTALRAITVNNPARIMEIAKIQKNTVSQPERIIKISNCELRISDCELVKDLRFLISKFAIRNPQCLRFVLHRFPALLEHLAVPDKAGA